MSNWVRCVGCLILAMTLAGCQQLVDEGTTKKDSKEKSTKPAGVVPKEDKAKTVKPAESGHGAHHKVEKGPFKIEVSLKGVFESEDMTEVSLHLEGGAMAPLLVLKAVEHGTRVQKGDTLVWLELEKIDQAIHDLENERAMTELSIKQAEEEFPILVKSNPLELAQTEHAKKMADEDLKKFLDTDRPQTEKMAHFMVKMASNYLEYVKEELRQLEKMYRANDIREETEEIILKRQRNQVEEMQFFVKQAEARRDLMLKFQLPRQQQSLEENAVKQGLALDKARVTFPLTLGQKKLALAKMKYDWTKSTEKMHKLQKDREAMTIKAPADGIVYFGKCVRGQWATASSVASRLQRGGSLQPEEVLITIVKPRPLFVRATVEEKDLQYVHSGLKGKVVAATLPDRKLAATVDQVSAIPLSPGTFEARLRIEMGKDVEALMPGMACTVKLVPYLKDLAVTVPNSAVFAEELNDDQHYVYLANQGKPEKRQVTVGKTSGDKTEIVTGLQAGEEILLEKPSAKKTGLSLNGK